MKRSTWIRTGLSCATTAFACQMLGVSATQRPVYKPSGSEATVEGIVSFVGQPPERKLFDFGQDPVCKDLNDRPKTLDVMVSDGRLANVLVYVKGSEVDSHAFPPPSTEVALTITLCQYSPRILGMQAGQRLAVYNNDPTTHNTHPMPSRNWEWNWVQAPGDIPYSRQFDRAEALFPVKCNQHPWEKAYIAVFDHPFFAVTSSDGSFKITGLPPGGYDLIFWHEKFGEQRAKISLRPNESLTQDVSFGPGTN